MMADIQLPTYQEHKPDEQARRQIGAVVFHDRHGDEELLVPTRAKPDVVTQFLEEQVTDALDWEPLLRCADLARFYVHTDAVASFEKLLNRNARTQEDLLKLVECIRLIGDLGDDDQRENAVPYFEYVLDHEAAAQVMDHVLPCLFHLSGQPGRKDVDARLQKQIGNAERRQRQGPGKAEPAELQAQRTLALPILFDAAAKRGRILQEPHDLARATALASAYLGLNNPGGVDWPTWAAFAIMGEIQRTSDENVVAGLEAALTELSDKEDEQYKRLARARATRAIAFFGGRLADDRRGWLAFDDVGRQQLEG
ncbi:MAG: hypothetical protein GY778_07260 [bacterium]|nr:hypothetical protein [bacterium]